MYTDRSASQRDPELPLSRPQLGTTAPAFVVGSRRSGTTLVSRVIDAHPAFSIYHESFLYPIFHSELRWYGDVRVTANLRRLIEDVREVLGTQIPDVPSLDRIHDALTQPTLSGVFGALLHLYALEHGKRRGGDKTPEHHRYLADLLRDFVGSPVVFTVRDPRDTVVSMQRVFDTSVEGAAHRWRDAFESYSAYADRVHLVKYETLVSEPEAEVRRLCAALGEEFDAGMLEFHRRTSNEFGRLGGEKLSSAIDQTSVGQLHALAESDLRMIEAACADGMERLGYAFAAGGRSGTAARAQRRQSRWRWIVDRLRYYGLKRRRWRRGAARWKVQARVRLRWLLLRRAPNRRGAP